MQEEQRIKDENVINLEERRLALAAKEPPKGGNWLSNLPFETRFLAARKDSGYILGDFMVATDPSKMEAVLLGFELGTRDGAFKWVDPLKFSQQHSLYMIIKTEIENGSTQIQTGRVEGDGQPEDVHPIHESE